MSKTSVLIIGATGRTGGSIVDALLTEPDYLTCRRCGPWIVYLKTSGDESKDPGPEIREADIGTAVEEQLVALLKDIEIVIPAIGLTQLQLIDAAKKAGVKRFIPCDWSPACVRGVRQLHDEKLADHDYVVKAGIGYTFIDAGLWFLLPINDPSKAFIPHLLEYSRQINGTGDVKCADIHIRDIGVFVYRILRDPRTLNRYVFCYAEEVTQNEIFAVAISRTIIDVIRVSEEDVLANAKKAQGIGLVLWKYTLSMWIRGDNTVENAKRAEYGWGAGCNGTLSRLGTMLFGRLR